MMFKRQKFLQSDFICLNSVFFIFTQSWSTRHGHTQHHDWNKMKMKRNCISKRLQVHYASLRHCCIVLRWVFMSHCVASAILFNLFYSPSVDRYSTLIRWVCLDNVCMVFHPSLFITFQNTTSPNIFCRPLLFFSFLFNFFSWTEI